jgi:exopolysaccharide biosynthesis polyprenyl glycosylphosphotransferase
MAAPDFVAPNFYAETIAPLRKEQRASSRTFLSGTIAIAEASADFLACSAGLFITHFLFRAMSLNAMGEHLAWDGAAISVAFGFVVIFLLVHDGIYRSGGGLLQIRETERAIRIPVQALFLLFVISGLLDRNFAWLEFLITIVAVPIVLIVEKQIFFSIARQLQRGERNIERVVVYGACEAMRSVLSTLLHSPRLGLKPVAVVEDRASHGAGYVLEMGYRGRRSIPVRRGPITPALLESLRCNLLLLATQSLSSEELAAASNAAREAGANVALIYGPAANEQHWNDLIDVDGVLVTTSRARSASWLYSVSKRITDVVVSSALLILLAPLLILIAILIRLDSVGSALFVQKRVGRNGELFSIFKFRSMYAGAPKYALSPTSSSDPRITRIGRILRRTSLDELPQLMNVFLGTMSLVGPRPEMPFIVECYDARQRQRLHVSPGITGIWQLSADRSFPIHQNIQYDLYYIRNRSFWMDAAILIHTLVFAVCGGI